MRPVLSSNVTGCSTQLARPSLVAGSAALAQRWAAAAGRASGRLGALLRRPAGTRTGAGEGGACISQVLLAASWLYVALQSSDASCSQVPQQGQSSPAGMPRTAGQSGGAPGCGASTVASSSPRLHTSLASAACPAGAARPTSACSIAACTPGSGAELLSSADRPASVSTMRPSSPSRTLLRGGAGSWQGRSMSRGH